MSSSNTLIDSLKTVIASQIFAQFGATAKPENAEKHERRQMMLDALESVKTIYDIADYLDRAGRDSDEFFIAYQVPLVTAGMDPLDVPSEVIQSLGSEVASEAWANGSWAEVYKYDGVFFAIDETEIRVFKTLREASASAGIGNDLFDKLQD
jgi:hypothetical protein